MSAPSNLSIAQAAHLKPITEIAAAAGLSDDDFEAYGKWKGKLTWAGIDRLKQAKQGKLILVTAITPTPAGEGKTTTSIGLVQGLCQIGHRAIPAIREPSLGPVFGNKGGAAGGGMSQVLPMEDINLFFTGDYPAITAAHNLLSSLIDAHLHHGNTLGLDLRRIVWPRTLDVNDRALRDIVVALGGTGNGYPREDGFIITAASEIMAILCLAQSLPDLEERLGNILVGLGPGMRPIRAKEIGGHSAMTVLLRDALRPNLVQTLEGGPAFVHGGPFANIAHGCSSLLATRCALGMADFVVTEAGFASDLGAEKFLNIVVPQLGRGPDTIVLVATVRALQHHGGGELSKGLPNLKRHLDHLLQYGPPVVVAINQFPSDTPDDHEAIIAYAREHGATDALVADPWGTGGPGCLDLAQVVADTCDIKHEFHGLYLPGTPIEDRLRTLIRKVYGGTDFDLADAARRRLEWAKNYGLDHLPVCMAKTQYSFSDQAEAGGNPEPFELTVREVRPSLGAGFLVLLAGEILQMPGLGKRPAALDIRLDEQGRIQGMF